MIPIEAQERALSRCDHCGGVATTHVLLTSGGELLLCNTAVATHGAALRGRGAYLVPTSLTVPA